MTNANFIEAATADGVRKCLADEFSSLYVFHLRGNQRTAGERSRKEGGKIFGSGSRAPVAISLLVKNPNAGTRADLRDAGDYLTQGQQSRRSRRSPASLASAKRMVAEDPARRAL